MIVETFFWLIYKLFVFNVVSDMKLPLDVKEKHKFLTSYIVSFTHALICVVYSSYLIYKRNFDIVWDDKTTSSELIMYNISMGYFLCDLGEVLMKLDYAFILHHIASLLIFQIFIRNDLSGFALCCLFLGEITNPIQCIWTVLKRTKYKKLYNIITPIFCYSFILIRGIISPYLLVKTFIYLYYTKSISTYDYFSLLVLFVLFSFASLYWVFKILKKYSHIYPLETYDAFKRQMLTMDEPKSPDLSGLVGDIKNF